MEKESKASSAGSRRCAVKISYSSGFGKNGLKRNAAKLAYISRAEAALAPERPEWETSDEKARMYAYDLGKKKALGFRAALARIGSFPVFRIILSPEDPRVDLCEFANRFMSRSFSRAVGRNGLIWAAANHYNTSHPHVHIVASRKPGGAKGKKLLHFSPAYVSEGAAARDAGEILTQMLGPRERPAGLEKEKEISALSLEMEREISEEEEKERREEALPAGLGKELAKARLFRSFSRRRGS